MGFRRTGHQTRRVRQAAARLKRTDQTLKIYTTAMAAVLTKHYGWEIEDVPLLVTRIKAEVERMIEEVQGG